MKNNTSSASSTYIAAERHGLPMGSQILPAQVITRWADGCHIRVADKHDTILPADALPVDADRFSIGVARDGVVVILAA